MLNKTVTARAGFLWMAVLLSLWLSLPCESLSQISDADADTLLDPLVGENNHYDLTYLKIPAVFVTFAVPEITQFQGRAVYHIVASAKTTPLCSSLIFKAHNTYHSFVDKATGLPIRYVKEVRQQNLEQDLAVTYDQVSGTASYLLDADPAIERQIRPKTHDFFSMLFNLRTRVLAVDSIYTLCLDVEGEEWNATVRVLGRDAVKVNGDSREALKMRLTFDPLNNAREIEDRHDTDVLTRRLVTEDTELYVWIEDSTRRAVLQMEYEMRFFNVHVILQREMGEAVLDVHGSRDK